MKFTFCLLGISTGGPTNEGYALVSEMNSQLSYLRGLESLRGAKNIGSAIDTWQSHEGYMRQRSAHPQILKKFVAIGKDLNLKGLIQQTLPQMLRSSGEGKLQSSEMFTNYGCYCLPSQAYTEDMNWIGRGTPVDEIDNLCKKLLTCYGCLGKTYSKCSASTPYAWDINLQGHKICEEPGDSCKGALCRCDIDFSQELSNISDKWNQKYSMHYGFDREKVCGVRKVTKQNVANGNTGARGITLENSGLNDPKCCGTGLNSVIYHPSRLECCRDGKTRTIGSCDV